MAKSSGPINGNLMYLYLNGVAVYRCTGITLNGNMDVIDVTSQTSAGTRDILPGMTSWSGSAEGIVDMSGTMSAYQLSTAMKARTVYKMKLIQMTSTGTHVHGDYYWSGNIYITGWTITSAPNDKLTFSITFEGDDVLNISALT